RGGWGEVVCKAARRTCQRTARMPLVSAKVHAGEIDGVGPRRQTLNVRLCERVERCEDQHRVCVLGELLPSGIIETPRAHDIRLDVIALVGAAKRRQMQTYWRFQY